MGDPLAREVVRAMMLIRANVLAKGFSGIRPLVAERLCELLNRGVTPVVPSQGSVGASGDLAPLAHMALVLIGEGEAEFDGRHAAGRRGAARAPASSPSTLHPKEGISLINGTQAMLAIGCLELEAAEVLADTADVVCAMTLDALRGTPRAFDERIHAARPHPGQMESAARLRATARRQRDPRNRTSPAAACRTPTRCAARRRCTARCATRWPKRAASSPSS